MAASETVQWRGKSKAVNERTLMIVVGGILPKSFSALNHTRILFRNSGGAKASRVNERTRLKDFGRRFHKFV